tara:strand:- start:152 stop:739 length:588 start_codon:yes stop_codon:yes gene_type:complete
MNLSDNLEDEYGETPMEQLGNIMFETKDKLDEKTYRIICELLVKINDKIDKPLEIMHCYTFKMVTPIVCATDDIKQQLDYISDNYNSDFEDEHDDDDSEDADYVETTGYCKLYLKEATNLLMGFDPNTSIRELLRNAMKNPQSFRNYDSALNVLINVHNKKIHEVLKNHIDIEWTKQYKTCIIPTMIKPWVTVHS